MIFGVTPAEGVFPGVSRVMKEAEALGLLKHAYVSDLRDAPKDAYLLFGAWHESYALPARRLKNPKGVLWSSPLLQSDLCGEHQLLEIVGNFKSQKMIRDLWPMDRGLFEILAAGGEEHAYWFPAPIAELPKAPNPPKERDYTKAALFAPWHPRKSPLTQASAAAAAGYEVHGNGIHQYAGPLAALGVKVVDHGWMTRDDYYNTLASCGVSLSAFLTESFCYTAADASALGVPFLASPAIRWAPQEFVVPDPGDLTAMREKLVSWRDPSVNNRMARIARHRIEKVREQANGILRDEFKRAGLLPPDQKTE